MNHARNPEGRNNRLYYSLSEFMKKRFGEKVYRVSLDGGFTCPNRDGTLGRGGCLYCNEAGARAAYVNPKLSITEQLENGSRIISRRYGAQKFIAYFQSYTNTYASLAKLRILYEEALTFPGIVGLAIGTRPDCINYEILAYLNTIAKDKLVILEYGVQSLNDKALYAVNRKHSAAESIRAIHQTRQYPNIHILAHVIFGLPHDDEESMLETVKTLCNNGIHALKFHHLYVEKNTRIASHYEYGKLKLLERDKYINLLIRALSFTPPNVVIHRLFGECSTDTLLAPTWTARKSENIRLFEQRIREQHITQGCALN